MIRYSEAKQLLAKYKGTGGSCPEDDGVDLFVKEVLQYMLLHGTYGNERKFIFHAQEGCITLPYELETPLKIKIGDQVGQVWNRWFEYHSDVNIDNFCLCTDALYTEANRYPTVYSLPSCGSFIGVTCVCEEDCDAHVVIKGKDPVGNEIYTVHKGEKVVGEYLSLKKGKLSRSTVLFGQITEVYKTKTNGYVTLLAVSEDCLSRSFLSNYGPYEQSPSYQRARLRVKCPPVCQVSILGRIRLKEYYADDDLIPFDNLFLLSVAGQTVNSMYNTDIQSAIARDGFAKGLIETENNYKKVNTGTPLDYWKPLSGGAVVNAKKAGRNLRSFFRRR